MRHVQAELTAHCLSPTGKPAIRLRLPSGGPASPGQPWLARVAGVSAIARLPLYPVRLQAEGFEAEIERLEAWPLGSTLDLLGPVGPGFRPPRNAHRWLLASLRGDLGRLYPLVELGLSRGCAVSAWSTAGTPRLPPAVEVLPALRDGLVWAEYVALDADPETLLRRSADASGDEPALRRSEGEVLLDLPLLCGFGGCLACAVTSRGEWKLACKDGPVFPLAEVLG
jgi:dihydroorotate dehydrogenase electron transfer subunit